MDRQPRVNLWIAAGWIIFLCAFVVPAYSDPGGSSPFGANFSTSTANDAMPINLTTPTLAGWDAMRAAFESDAYPVASATTNILLVLSVLAAWSRPFAWKMCWIVGTAAVFNLWWLHAAPDGVKALRVGYYLWVFSYLLVAIGMFKLGANATRPNPNSETPV